MQTVIGLFHNESGVECAVEGMRRVGVGDGAISVLSSDSDVSARLGIPNAPGGFEEGLRRGGRIVAAEVPEEYAMTCETVMRQAGASDIAARASEEAGWVGSREVAGTERPYRHAENEVGRDLAEPSAANTWNMREKLESPTDLGAGAAAGGTMGAPLGAGATAAGGLMGATPGDSPADDLDADMPNPDRQADIARQRRANDPAP
ncbi:MAG: hypothetical protein RLZZ387_2971 [Chloroflexota bacterium]